jgi:hypothetical protein
VVAAAVPRIVFALVIGKGVPADVFAQPEIARDFRASLAASLGIPARNVLIRSIRDRRTNVIITFSISSDLNRGANSGNGNGDAASLGRKLAAVRASMVRGLQAAEEGLEVTTEVITANLDGSNAMTPAQQESLATAIAETAPAELLAEFIEATGPQLGFTAADVAVVEGSVATSTPAPATAPESTLPGGAVGGIAAAAAIVGIIVIAVAIVVVLRRSSARNRRVSSDNHTGAAHGTAVAAGDGPTEVRAQPQQQQAAVAVMAVPAGSVVQEWGAPRAAPQGGEPVMVQVVHKPAGPVVMAQHQPGMPIGSVAAMAPAPGQPGGAWVTSV